MVSVWCEMQQIQAEIELSLPSSFIWLVKWERICRKKKVFCLQFLVLNSILFEGWRLSLLASIHIWTSYTHTYTLLVWCEHKQDNCLQVTKQYCREVITSVKVNLMIKGSHYRWEHISNIIMSNCTSGIVKNISNHFMS